MIVKSIQKNVVESHDFKSEIATIDASEMRYISSLLRNNYSDTILATVRETWANAVDANSAANSATPIKISFPTHIAPTYSVRDFGGGLSEEELFGLYTKYGRSSKRGDNSAIGGFGIGRFSPLSYTDSFTVVSCKDGEKIIISVYVDESGDTRFTKLAEESTTESNGVEISVAVKKDDIAKFSEAGHKVLKFASAPFVSSGIQSLKTLDWVIKNNTWGVLKHINSSGYYHSRSDSPVIVMGGISYPLNLEMLSDRLSSLSIYKSLKDSSAASFFVFFFPVGSLSLHHSRESLEYNELTKKNLVSFFSNLEAEIRLVFQKTLNDISDVEQFMLKVNSISDNYVLQSVASDIPLIFNASNGDKIQVQPNLNLDVTHGYCVNRNGNFRTISLSDKKRLNPAMFYHNSSYCILVADSKKSLFAKSRWIQKNRAEGIRKGFCVVVITPEDAKAFLTSYTTCDRIFLSSTTKELKPDEAKSSEARIVFDKVLYDYKPFVTQTNLPEDKFYYVKLQTKDRRFYCEIAGQEFSRSTSFEFFTKLYELKVLDQTRVYGVQDDSDLGDEAINLATLVEDYIKKQLKTYGSVISQNHENNYRASKFRGSVKNVADRLDKKHPLNMFYGTETVIDKQFSLQQENVMELLRMTQQSFSETIDKTKINAEYDALVKKYPIVMMFSNYYGYHSEEHCKHMVDYISLIDKQ